MEHGWCDICGHDYKMCSCNNTGNRYVAQEGGDHYQSTYQHWDWVTDVEMGYLPASATKYVSRWRKKNGLADLKKAMTYIDKMSAVIKDNPSFKFNREASYKTRIHTDDFVVINGLSGIERSICELLTGPCHDRMLELVKEKLSTLMQRALEGQGGGAGIPPPTKASSGPTAPKTGLPGGVACTTTQPPASSVATERSDSSRINHPAPFGFDEWHEGQIKT